VGHNLGTARHSFGAATSAVDDLLGMMQDFYRRNAWMADGLCAQTDPELFFPESGQGTKAAEKICARCPVQAECFDFAMETGEGYGIWGGACTRTRKEILKRENAA